MSTNEISPIIPIENKKFLCVEYPGYVRNTQRAIKTLGGENTLADAIANDLTVTINYRPGVTFTHPTTGCVLPSSKLLVKVTRRVKKNKTTGEIEAEDPNTPWKTEVVGTIPKTLRFRGKPIILAHCIYQFNIQHSFGRFSIPCAKGRSHSTIEGVFAEGGW
jgi:general transcription factor 3C polypeptide 5 (transcription factor C subunit 1)